MKFRTSIAAIAVSLSIAPVYADINSDIAQTRLDIRNDSEVLSGWFSNLLKDAVPYNSTTGAVVPKQLKLFGFDIGVSGGASVTDTDEQGFRNLNTKVVSTSNIDLIDPFPMPLIMGHIKVGIPGEMDLGIRVGGIPSTDIDEGDTHLQVDNTVLGVDLRKIVFDEGITRPFGLTVGVNYTRAKGTLQITQPYSANSVIVQAGQTYNATLAANGVGTSDWTTHSAGVQAIVNKQILFFNPYLGASANKNWGDVDTTIRTQGTVRIEQANNTANVRQESVDETGSSHATPNRWDMRALAGFELNPLPFLKLGLYGEYAGSKNMSGTLGLRFQFR